MVDRKTPRQARLSSAKSTIDDLAMLGGQPLVSTPLFVGRPNIFDRATIHARLDEAMDRGWLTNDGPLVREFEDRLTDFVGGRYGVAVANATLGLQLVAVALGLRGEVIMPSFTFIGTAHALAWMGLKPVFADVLAGSHTLDPADAAALITPATTAILGVHLWGGACRVDDLQEIAERHGLELFFDAAHATGSSYRGQAIGKFGRAAVFSLHATKGINALEAGLITTDDPDLAQRLRLLRNYSIVDEDIVSGLGINAKLNEFSAAMGLTNLEHFDWLRDHNEQLHVAYRAGLGRADGVSLLTINPGERHSHHYAVLEVDPSCALSRDQLRSVLVAEGVHVRRYFTPGCHRSPPYLHGEQVRQLAETERLSDSLLQLPTGQQLDERTARQIGEIVALAIKEAPRIRPLVAVQPPPVSKPASGR